MCVFVAVGVSARLYERGSATSVCRDDGAQRKTVFFRPLGEKEEEVGNIRELGLALCRFPSSMGDPGKRAV